MQSTTFNRPFVKLFTLVVCCLSVLSFTTKLGLDSYEIYLNSRLLLKQSVNQPLDLRKLQLNRTAAGDQLRIYYRHCHTPNVGTDRSLIIKDGKGHALKKWTFTNVSGSDLGMVIPVKELLRLKKENPQQELRIHYFSRELSKGEMLASLRF
ncbi:hypothetical protein [Niabella aurantiaca]|uniref:hypothetical protein n=1 Tax=Niabella aurantiaca TaxID=379900 RepID=UPI0003701F35|nr:hypothetical protein [Niabella aurantiaca]